MHSEPDRVADAPAISRGMEIQRRHSVALQVAHFMGQNGPARVITGQDGTVGKQVSASVPAGATKPIDAVLTLEKHLKLKSLQRKKAAQQDLSSRLFVWWAMPESNQRLPACQAGTLTN